jgi:transposase
LNQIDFSDIKTLNIEDIKNLRRGKRTSGYLSRWTYTDLRSKLTSLACSSGVQMNRLSPTYTSQRCHKCGWTRKANRKGKKFICKACGNACDADRNASLNISFDPPAISMEERLRHNNKTGFYWNADWKEPIVSSVQKII